MVTVLAQIGSVSTEFLESMHKKGCDLATIYLGCIEHIKHNNKKMLEYFNSLNKESSLIEYYKYKAAVYNGDEKEQLECVKRFIKKHKFSLDKDNGIGITCRDIFYYILEESPNEEILEALKAAK